MKILYVSPQPKSATSFYRGLGMLAQLQKQYNYISVTDASNSEISWAVMQQHDILYLERPYRDQDLYVAHMAKLNGIKIWVDHDDIFDAITSDNPFYYELGESGLTNTKVINSMADVITASTPGVKAALSKDVHAKTHVIPNMVQSGARFMEHNANSMDVLYRGGRSHYYDVEEYADSICDAFELMVGHKLHLWGFFPYSITYWMPGRYDYKPDGDIMLYFQRLHALRPRIVIVPLIDTAFNKGKSDIAYLEATQAGAVTLVPNFLPEFDKPGVIKYGDHRSFHTALVDAMKGNYDTQALHRQAREYVESQRMRSRVMDSYCEVLHSLT